MAKTKKLVVKEIQNPIEQTTAEKLREVELHIADIEETYKRAMEPLEKEVEALRAQLTETMLKSKILSIKTQSGDQYILENRHDIKVVDETEALKYATRVKLVRPDLVPLKAHIRKFFSPYEDKEGIHVVPKGFEQVEKQTLKIKRFNG